MEYAPTPVWGVAGVRSLRPSMESWSGNELGWLVFPWVWGCPVGLWVPLPSQYLLFVNLAANEVCLI